ncbi:MAG: flagellar biosynthesis protein FlhB [Geminicoccaceae bacterium]|nr:MAG: flagellar biosynthesis protein FlhB [Geminicoccaceae bacterium]
MADQPEKADKTEEPTPKRLEDAQRDGQVATSRDLTSLLLLSVGVFLLSPLGAGIFAGLLAPLRSLFDRPHQLGGDPAQLADVVVALGWAVGLVLALPFGAFMAAAIASNLAQHGFVLSLKPVQPKLNRISPLAGLKRLFAPKSLAEALKNMAKVLLVGAAAWLAIQPVASELVGTMQMPMPDVLSRIQNWLLRATGAALIVVAAIAVADVMLQRHSHHQQMKMTRRQVKDEAKQTDGDPHVKAKIRQLRMERARHRMMAAVPEATVVITNPTHFAVALRYEPGKTSAPEVVAKGADAVAFRIRAVAREHDVPIIENRPLARALFADVDIGQTIPERHFAAVAEVIGFVFRQRDGFAGAG